jgi:preprotein translocase SecE subunit
MGPNKYVHMVFAVGGLIATYLLVKVGDWAWSYFAKPQQLLLNAGALVVALVATLAAYKSERVFAAAYDVTRELEKVTWPTRKEIRVATIVVIVTVAVAAVILWAFDFVWGSLANLLIR